MAFFYDKTRGRVRKRLVILLFLTLLLYMILPLFSSSALKGLVRSLRLSVRQYFLVFFSKSIKPGIKAPQFFFNSSSMHACLFGKRVYFLGNSIARGFFYETLSMLEEGTISLKRNKQQAACGNQLNGNNNETCGIEINGVNLHFTWIQLFDGLAPGIPHDACTAASLTTRACLQNILSNALPGDVLLFYVGLHYAIHKQDVFLAEPAFFFDSWLKKSTASWKSDLSTLWPGRLNDIYRVRLANMKVKDEHQQNSIDEIPFINSAMDEFFEGSGWNTIDQWGINAGREDLYEDHVHFPGTLSRVTLNCMLSEFCGNPNKLHRK